MHGIGEELICDVCDEHMQTMPCLKATVVDKEGHVILGLHNRLLFDGSLDRPARALQERVQERELQGNCCRTVPCQCSAAEMVRFEENSIPQNCLRMPPRPASALSILWLERVQVQGVTSPDEVRTCNTVHPPQPHTLSRITVGLRQNLCQGSKQSWLGMA
eukprot:352555-Chlamydomonas_euryale.AAC.5